MALWRYLARVGLWALILVLILGVVQATALVPWAWLEGAWGLFWPLWALIAGFCGGQSFQRRGVPLLLLTLGGLTLGLCRDSLPLPQGFLILDPLGLGFGGALAVAGETFCRLRGPHHIKRAFTIWGTCVIMKSKFVKRRTEED